MVIHKQRQGSTKRIQQKQNLNLMETLKPAKDTKAVKDHICGFCNMKIKKGETYIKSTHTHDGEIYDWKTHPHCEWIANTLGMYDFCDDGMTGEDFMESIHEEYKDLMIKLLPGPEKRYTAILSELNNVMFRHKLGYVIRHYRSMERH